MNPRKPDISALTHQQEGTEFLRNNQRAALFDEQGLGKSKQLIDAIASDIQVGVLQGALIVCPNGLKSNWADEIEKFCTLPYAAFGSGRQARRMAFQSMRASFYIINYEAVASEMASLKALLRFKPMALVLDESHRIKTPDAKVTKAVHQLREFAHRRYILTGTPVANRPDDLWSQMYFLDDGESLGESFEKFQQSYRTSTGGYQNIDSLRDRIAPRSLRRVKTDALDLPEKLYTRVAVELQGRQRAMYDQMRSDLELWVTSLTGAEVLEKADAVLARLVRLAQLASNPRLIDAGYDETPAKFLALDQLLERYMDATDRKVIVWSSFVGNIRALASRYPQWNPVTIYGEMDNDSRDRSVSAFRGDPQTRLLIANPAAAREGLTLTESNVAIYLDRTFNLVDYLQSQDRIHRISQTRQCEIVLLVAQNTIDEFVDFSLEQKHRLAKFSQSDVSGISADDLALRKPDILKALIGGVRTEG